MPRKSGKRYRQLRDRLEGQQSFELDEAIRLVKEGATAKFDETIEVAMRLGVNPKHADQIVRGTVVLPHGTGRVQRVLVFADGEKAAEARDAGADYVGVDDLVERIQGGWYDFDVAVAMPTMMPKVGRLGKLLGPRGLMPNPKSGTVTMDIARAVEEIKAGKIEYRVDRGANIHAPIGRASFEALKLRENALTLLETIVRARPASAKGQYVRSVTLSSTMGIGIPLDPIAIANMFR